MKEKKFVVSVCREVSKTLDFNVSIESTGDDHKDSLLAKAKAVEMAANHDFGSGGNAEYHIDDFKEVDE